MAQYKFKQAYNLTESPIVGGALIKAFSAGDVVEGTPRVQQLAQWGAPNVNWVDTQWGSIPTTFLEPVSNILSNIPAPVKGLLGLGAIFILLKFLKDALKVVMQLEED